MSVKGTAEKPTVRDKMREPSEATFSMFFFLVGNVVVVVIVNVVTVVVVNVVFSPRERKSVIKTRARTEFFSMPHAREIGYNNDENDDRYSLPSSSSSLASGF